MIEFKGVPKNFSPKFLDKRFLPKSAIVKYVLDRSIDPEVRYDWQRVNPEKLPFTDPNLQKYMRAWLNGVPPVRYSSNRGSGKRNLFPLIPIALPMTSELEHAAMIKSGKSMLDASGLDPYNFDHYIHAGSPYYFQILRIYRDLLEEHDLSLPNTLLSMPGTAAQASSYSSSGTSARRRANLKPTYDTFDLEVVNEINQWILQCMDEFLAGDTIFNHIVPGNNSRTGNNGAPHLAPKEPNDPFENLVDVSNWAKATSLVMKLAQHDPEAYYAARYVQAFVKGRVRRWVETNKSSDDLYMALERGNDDDVVFLLFALIMPMFSVAYRLQPRTKDRAKELLDYLIQPGKDRGDTIYVDQIKDLKDFMDNMYILFDHKGSADVNEFLEQMFSMTSRARGVSTGALNSLCNTFTATFMSVFKSTFSFIFEHKGPVHLTDKLNPFKPSDWKLFFADITSNDVHMDLYTRCCFWPSCIGHYFGDFVQMLFEMVSVSCVASRTVDDKNSYYISGSPGNVDSYMYIGNPSGVNDVTMSSLHSNFIALLMILISKGYIKGVDFNNHTLDKQLLMSELNRYKRQELDIVNLLYGDNLATLHKSSIHHDELVDYLDNNEYNLFGVDRRFLGMVVIEDSDQYICELDASTMAGKLLAPEYPRNHTFNDGYMYGRMEQWNHDSQILENQLLIQAIDTVLIPLKGYDFQHVVFEHGKRFLTVSEEHVEFYQELTRLLPNDPAMVSAAMANRGVIYSSLSAEEIKASDILSQARVYTRDEVAHIFRFLKIEKEFRLYHEEA